MKKIPITILAVITMIGSLYCEGGEFCYKASSTNSFNPCADYTNPGDTCLPNVTEMECTQYVKVTAGPGLPELDLVAVGFGGHESTLEKIVCIRYGECLWDPIASKCSQLPPYYENGPYVTVLSDEPCTRTQPTPPEEEEIP